MLHFYVIEGQRMCTVKKKTQGHHNKNLALFTLQSHYMSAGRIVVCVCVCACVPARAPHVITWFKFSLPFPPFFVRFFLFLMLSLHNAPWKRVWRRQCPPGGIFALFPSRFGIWLYLVLVFYGNIFSYAVVSVWQILPSYVFYSWFILTVSK